MERRSTMETILEPVRDIVEIGFSQLFKSLKTL